MLGCGSGLNLSFQDVVASMESVGINVFSTMKKNGIKLEVHPKNKIRLCNLLCSKQPIQFKEHQEKKQKELIDFIEVSKKV